MSPEFECRTCGQEFDSRTSLEQHKHTEHITAVYNGGIVTYPISPPVVVTEGSAITFKLPKGVPTVQVDSVTLNTNNTSEFHISPNTGGYIGDPQPHQHPTDFQLCYTCGGYFSSGSWGQHNSHHERVNKLESKVAVLTSILEKISDVDALTLGDLVGIFENGSQH